MADEPIIVIDPNRLTLDELEDVEEIVGATAGAIFAGTGLSAKAMKALVFVLRRRDDPDFTLADAGSIDLGRVQIAGAEPDPTDAAG